MMEIEGSIRHKLLLLYGMNQKGVHIEGDAEGATKLDIEKAASGLFGLENKSLILQFFDKDFEDYVDIEEDQKIPGPTKILVRVEEPVVFPVTINVNQGDIEQIENDASTDTLPPVVQQPQNDAADDVAEDTAEDAAINFKPVADVAATSSSTESQGRQASVSWITGFAVPVQPPLITSKLKLGGDTLNTAERGHFLDSIYSAVTKNHGIYYPTKTEYDIMVEKIHAKFPQMCKPAANMPLGDKKMLWKHRLQYKFQNKRKRLDLKIEAVQKKKLKAERKPRSPPPSTVDPPTYWGMKNYLPSRPASEDDLTIATHIGWLNAEKRRKQPDYKTVSCSMTKTLADRRKWIISSKPKPTLDEIQVKYPWLFDEDQMSEEMQRIKDDVLPLQKRLANGLNKYATALIRRGQGKRNPHRFFEEVVSAIPLFQAEKDQAEATLEAALLSIPGLFQELITDIFVPVDKTTVNPSHVYIRMDAATPYKTEQFTLVVDGTDVAHSTTILGASTLWIESFYVFNLSYPTCVSNSLIFLQRIILIIDDQLPVARTIRMQVNKLNAC
ncbi:uncharacterized protein [Apostichopus japonicus]|uniref:uncharacterized protein isoform X2 n=1 Tax=Stichopus japonicus TaxID=307972 RepID=UPI003AB7A219